MCPALRTGCGCSVLISGSPRTASTTCYFYLTYTRRTAQTGHLHGLLSLFPGLRCLLLLQLLCHLGLPLNLTEALAAHFLGSKTFFCTQLRKKGKKKKHIQKGLLPPKLFTVQENQQLRLSVSLFSQNLQSQDSLQQKMEKKHESWPTGAQCEEISHIHSSNNPNTICFCPLIYKLAFKRGGEIKLCLPQMDLSVDSLGKGRKHRPRERTAVIRDVLCLLSRK